MKAPRPNAILLAGLLACATGFNSEAALIHQWMFNDGTANDSVGTANATLYGSAVITNGQLSLDSTTNCYAATATQSDNLNAKTLMVWERLRTKNQGAGCPISVETPAKVTSADPNSPCQVFDAIDYGERTTNQWMAGSDNYTRSAVTNGGSADASLMEHMIAITYTAEGVITIYRDGALYANAGSFSNKLYNFTSERYLLGRRHDTGVGPEDPWFNGLVDEARVYDTALTAPQIAAIYAQWPPNLSIRQAGTAALLSWPTNAMAFILQQGVSPATTNWTVVTNLPSLTNQQYQLMVALTNNASFYRLSTP